MIKRRVAYDSQINAKQSRGGISRYFNLLAGNIDICSDIRSVAFGKSIFGRVDAHCDIVHATYYSGSPYSLSQSQFLVSTLHDMIPERHPEHFFLPSLRSPHGNKIRWLNASDLIISVSASSADDFEFFLPESASRLVVIHHGTDIGVIQPAMIADLSNRQFYLFVGKRNGYKNGMLLLRLLVRLKSAGLLTSEFPVLVFAGGGPLSVAERRIIASHSLDSHLYFCSPSDAELAWLYRNSEAVLVPSIVEGFSFPVVEALACDAPVIASDIEVHREVCGSYSSQLSPHNVLAWLDCIVHHGYCRPSETMDELSHQCLLSHYSISRFIAEHALAYAGL
jgi:glycosyltransferase involved in cell wall biosynthesis